MKARDMKARSIKAQLRPLLFLLGLVFLWPAAVNGDAFAFADSLSYARAADTAMQSLTGLHSERLSQRSLADGGALSVPERTRSPQSRAVIHGRSVYYGLLPWLGVMAGTFWPVIALQALLAGFVVAAAVRQVVGGQSPRLVGVTVLAFALLAATPLPWFVCFLMPDVLVGLAIAAAALVLTGWNRQGRTERCGLLAVCAIAALSHASAIAVLAAMAGGGALWLWRKPVRNLRPAAWVMAAALAGYAGDAAFALAAERATGVPPLRPPFLTARLFEDGPARHYHARHCDRARFVLCRHPLSAATTAEVFLWSEQPGLGGFKALPPSDRAGVAAEQGAFVMAVVRAYPLETAAAMARNLGRLALRTDLAEFQPPNRATALMLSGAPASTAGDARMRGVVAAASALSALSAVLSLVVMAAMLWRRRTSSAAPLALVAVGALLANDMVCAWLSGPFARYQTRALWLLPLMALLLLASQRGADQGSNAPPTA